MKQKPESWNPKSKITICMIVTRGKFFGGTGYGMTRNLLMKNVFFQNKKKVLDENCLSSLRKSDINCPPLNTPLNDINWPPNGRSIIAHREPSHAVSGRYCRPPWCTDFKPDTTPLSMTRTWLMFGRRHGVSASSR